MAAPAVAVNPAPDAKPTSWAPTAKVSAGALAGSATTVVLVFLKAIFKNVQITPEITAAITAVITFLVQYMVPERT